MIPGGVGVAPPGPSTTSGFAPVRDAGALLDHGQVELRRRSLAAVCAGLRAADPATAVREVVHLDGSVLQVGDWTADLNGVRSVVLLGAGKASVPIAEELERILGSRLSGGLVVRRRGGTTDTHIVELLDADHPVPSAASHAAGRRLLDAAAAVHPEDLVITAFTGGSSALACVPAPGISLAAKQGLHRLLLASGASIAEINVVRKHTSALKGGRLAAAIGGARIVNLTLSDVVGDSIDLICDPVVQDTSSVAQACMVLQRYDLWDSVHQEIRDHLSGPHAESPVLGPGFDITTVMLTSGADIIEQMAAQVRADGGTPAVFGSSIEGEAAVVGGILASLASESSRHARPFASGTVLLGAGGETTATVANAPALSRGGPNQEVALAFARTLARLGGSAAAVFVDSDGLDGGTVAAGGCVDNATAYAATYRGVDLDVALARHDTMPALAALDDLVVTGQTGTNVSDIWAVAIGGPDDVLVSS